MKIQVLEDLYYEINRLFIAGERFAANDPRISKLIPQLEKLGEKSPAIKKLAELTSKLVNSDSEKGKLTDTANLLYSILNTQGNAELSAEIKLEEIEISKETESKNKADFAYTDIPYSKLKPLIEALTTKQSGRVEIIKSALENGEYNDFRLYQYYSKGLEDKYHEVAEILFEDIIPSVGAPMLSSLLADFNIDGIKANTKRLELIYNLGYEKSEEIAHEVLEKVSRDDMICVALKILGDNPENEKYLLRYADEKKADIVSAALVGLAKINCEEGNKKILSVLSGKKYKSAIDAYAIVDYPEYADEFLNAIEKHYDNIIDKLNPDKPPYDFLDLMKKGLRDKTSDNVYAFIKKILTDKRMMENPYTDIAGHAAWCLGVKNTKREYDIFDEILKGEHVAHSEIVSTYMAFSTSSDSEVSKKELFDKFSPLYTKEVHISSDRFKNLSDDWFKLFIDRKDISKLTAMLYHENVIGEKFFKKAKEIILVYTNEFNKLSVNPRENTTFKFACSAIINTGNDDERKQISENIMKVARNWDVNSVDGYNFYRVFNGFFYTNLLAKPEIIKEFEEINREIQGKIIGFNPLDKIIMILKNKLESEEKA